MKKIIKNLLLLFIILFMGLGAFADERQEASDFFQNFISASNNYSPSLPRLYSDNAKIIRQVVKPDGKLVNAYFSIDDYRKQMRISAKIAKIKNYKNYYSNIRITKVSNGYRIDALRRPAANDYKLKSSTVVQKQSDGKWLIVEELMQTKEQIFLKYAK